MRSSQTRSGLASHINNIAAAAALSKKPLHFFVDDVNLNYRCDSVSSSPWQSLFLGYPQLWTGRHILAAPPSEGIRTDDGKGRNCTAVNYKFSHQITGTDPEVAFSEMGIVMKNFWHFEAQTQVYINRHFDSLKQLLHPFIAIHARGGDKRTEMSDYGWASANSTDYLQALDLLPESVQNQGGTCLFIGDDLLVLEEIVSVVSKYVMCTIIIQLPPQFSTEGMGHDQVTFNRLAPKCEMSRLLLAQLHAMASADYFLCTFTSNVARLVQLLRVHVYDKENHTGLDVLGRPWVPAPHQHPLYRTRKPRT